jgi:hypothetical protein
MLARVSKKAGFTLLRFYGHGLARIASDDRACHRPDDFHHVFEASVRTLQVPANL